jgi:hypothetical protein
MIVAYAPRYMGEGVPNGHYSVFQDALFEESIKMGLRFQILSRSDVSGDGAIPLLRSTHFEENVTIIENFLDDRTEVSHFFVYEGELELIGPISRLASRFPKVKFVLNMMRADVPIATPASKKYRIELKKFLKSEIKQNFCSLTIPNNVKILCETDSRSFLLETLGIHPTGNFPTFSQFTRGRTIYEIDNNKSLERTNPLQVFFPRAISVKDKKYFSKFLVLIFLLRKELQKKDLEFNILSHNLLTQILIKAVTLLLGNRQVHSELLPLSEEDYWLNFSHADLIVLIETPLYMTQSSGKAIDALVAGTPVLATSGTYGAKECDRWIEGFPSFTSMNQLAQVLCMGKDLAAIAHSTLREKKIQIRNYYSVNRALHFICNL